MNTIDYKHWFSLKAWTFEQAAYLLLGIDPNDDVQISMVHDYKYKMMDSSNNSISNRYTKYLQSFDDIDFSDYDTNHDEKNKINISALFKAIKKGRLARVNQKLIKAWENSPKNPDGLLVAQTTVTTSTNVQENFGQDLIDAFDSLPITTISEIFSTSSITLEQWINIASKAKNNGLIDARTKISIGSGKSLFNPVKVANWLIAKKGIAPERLSRKLKTNLPSRSNEKLEDLFGLN